jgi:hypothetical protein
LKSKMDDQTTTKSIGTLAFDGKAEKFAMWWPRFRAFAAVQKFDKQLSDDQTNNKMLSKSGDYATSDPAVAKKLEEAEDKNNFVRAYFTMAFMSAQLMGMIDSATSDKW